VRVVIRPLHHDDIDACASILASLPDWFGDPASNVDYVAALGREPAFVAIVDDQVRGFVARHEVRVRTTMRTRPHDTSIARLDS